MTPWDPRLAAEIGRQPYPLLYVYRVLLTGIRLMRTGTVEANLTALNEEFRLPYVAELVARKQDGPERATLPDADAALHEREFARLLGLLEEEAGRGDATSRCRSSGGRSSAGSAGRRRGRARRGSTPPGCVATVARGASSCGRLTTPAGGNQGRPRSGRLPPG